MDNPSFDFLKRFSDLPKDSFKKLMALAKSKKYPAKTVICKAGEIPENVHFLTSGVLRSFVTTESGKEYNKRLYSPISFAGALTAILSNEASMLSFETLTECSLFEINFNSFIELCREDFNVGRLYVRVLEHVFIKYEERNLDLITLSSKENYLKLRKQIPNIDELIPQYQIASYLGITAVQLSRIRKELR